MMSQTHLVLSIAATSLMLGTADPVVLSLSALSSQLPDVDTTKSYTGRILLPLSRYLEKRFPHRSLTHSFLALTIFAFLTSPLAFWGQTYWLGLISGYFWGFFGDVFTKSGAALFYPSQIRAVCPGNPRIRLTTGSNAEWFLLFLLVAIAIISIHINSSGGILRSFNQSLGIPSGAIETINEDASRYLLTVAVTGRNAVTQEPVNQSFEVIQPLSQSDLLVIDTAGIPYRVGRSQQSQIVASQMRVKRGQPITVKSRNLTLEDTEIYGVMAKLPQARTYLSGTLTIFDAEDLILPTHPDRFDTITLQPGSEIAYARLTAASPREVMALLGDYFASGNLIMRKVDVQ